MASRDTSHGPPPVTAAPEVANEMTARDFARVADRIRAMAGIEIEEHKRPLAVCRLARRLRARRFRGFAAYLDHLDGGSDPAEEQEFVNTLTTNITSMFREAHHFAHLEQHLLAPLAGKPERGLRIWSAGCSSGEEAFSAGLTILEALGGVPAQLRILATDLDTAMLARARQASVPAERCAKLPARYRRHLLVGEDAGELLIPAAVRDAIEFRRLNLLDPWPITGRFDAIFCRNVMIYFSAETAAALIDRLARRLAPRGALYLGHSEPIARRHPLLEPIGNTIYLRRGCA